MAKFNPHSKDGISVFCADGKTFSVVTPFEMERMWPLPRGLLLQRAKPTSSASYAHIPGLHEDVGFDDAPTMWSLKHPLEELRPVPFFDFRSSLAADFVPTPLPANRKETGSTPKTPGMKDPQFETQLGKLGDKVPEDDGDFSRLICLPHLRLVYSSADVPLIVLYNSETKLHSIWLIRKAEKTEICLANEPSEDVSDLNMTSESLQASFQAGYTRDLRWQSQSETPISPPKCDLRLEHIFTEIPRYAAKESKSPYAVRNIDGDGYEGSPQANHIFLLVTPEAHLRLCFMITEIQQLHIYELTSPEDEDLPQNFNFSEEHAYASSPSSDSSSDMVKQSTLRVVRKRVVNCLSAIPLKVMDSVLLRIAKRSVLLSPTYLILGLDHTISLYSMETKICDCHIPSALAIEGAKMPANSKTTLATPTLHRTPSTSILSRSLTASTLLNRSLLNDSATKAEKTKFLQTLPRTPMAFNRSISQSHLVFSPMTPGSPFHLEESTEMDLSAMEFDDEIDAILNAHSGLPPTTIAVSSATMATRGTESFQTPAKRLPIGSSLLTGVETKNSIFTPGSGLPSRLPAPPTSEGDTSTKVIEILQPVSNRFSILYGDGRIFRVGLKIAPSDPTVSECLKAASCILHHSSLYIFISEYLGFKHALKTTIVDEFEIFRLFCLSLMSPTRDIIKKEQGITGLLADDSLKIGADDDDWEYLLDSDFHAQRMREPSYRSIPIKKELASSSYLPSQNSSQVQGESESQPKSLPSQKSAFTDLSITDILKPLCKTSDSVRFVQNIMLSWSLREDAQSLCTVLSHIHHALHLLCENYKLSVLTLPNVTKMTRMLLEFSALERWPIYSQFYASVLNTLPVALPQDISKSLQDDPSNVAIQPLMVQPPTILQWLRNCLNYARITFPILREANSPCELTRKLCRIYHVLVHGPPPESDEIEAYFEPFSTLPVSLGARLHKTPRTSPIKTANLSLRQRTLWKVRARLAVVAMDEEFADSSEINNFPPGVSLPLREAIQSTRQFPPPHWPLSCYRFIGREDLAMQGLSFGKVSKAKFSLPDSYLDGNFASSGGGLKSNESGLAKVLNTPSNASSSSTAGANDSSSGSASGNFVVGGGPNANNAAVGGDGSTVEMNFDGTDLTASATLMRFSKDERLSEVSRLLRSSQIIQLVETEEIAHQADAAQMTSYSQQLLLYAMRSLALPVGRGMFTLAAELDHWGNTEIGDMIPSDDVDGDFRERIAKKDESQSGSNDPKFTKQGNPSSNYGNPSSNYGNLSSNYGNNPSSYGNPLSQSGKIQSTSKVSPLTVLKSCARAEPLSMPQVMLKGRRPDNRTLVVFEPAPGAVIWSEFHNGVAAGLRLPPADVEEVSWQWIISNRPKLGLSASHAGMLLACGLLGHFKSVDPTGLYDYLSHFHPLTSASLLVGYASSAYGTRSSQLSKVLEVHLPKPIDASSPSNIASGLGFESDEVKVPEIVQCAAIVSAGLGFAETSNRHHVELFLSHLAHPRFTPFGLESFTLSCGIALGFICLGQGSSSVGLTDLNLLSRLCDCMDGGAAQRSKSTTTRVASLPLGGKTTVLGAQTAQSTTTFGNISNAISLSRLHEEARSAHGLTSILSHNPLFAPPASGFQGDAATARMTPHVPLRLGAFEMGIEPRRATLPISTVAEKPNDAAAVQMKAPSGINKEISAPGAVMALTLIFLKTNDAGVASRLALPKGGQHTSGNGINSNSSKTSSTGNESHASHGMKSSSGTSTSHSASGSASSSSSSSASSFQNNVMHLASIRPDVQIQRVIGRNLVMWDEMDASNGLQGLTQWLGDQYPVGASSVAQNFLLPAHLRLAPELVVLKHYSKSASSSSSSSSSAAQQTQTKKSGAAGAAAFSTTTLIGGVSVDIEEATNLAKSIDGYRDIFELLKISFLTTTGGCMMALGIKYAGTGNAQVISLLSTQLALLWKLQKAIPEKMDKKVCETCILQITLAWSLVQAGTGDLNLLRVLRRMRKKMGLDGKTSDGVYGYHMAMSMAIGFLFLGGGRYSISTSNKAIASLLTSLYPLWPLTPPEDRYHLQLLRHLYVLGIEPRCLEARDVDLLTPEFVPVKFWVQKDAPSHASHTSSSGSHTEKRDGSAKTDTQNSTASIASTSKVNLFDSTSSLPAKSTSTIEVIETMTPCLMPPRDRLLKVEISSPFYWRASFRPNGSILHQHMFQHQKFLLVKKRHGSALEGDNFIPHSHGLPALSAASSIVPSSQFSFDPEATTAAPANEWAIESKSPYALSSRILSQHPTLTEYAKFLLSNPDEVDVFESGDLTPNRDVIQMDLHKDLETLDILKSCLEEDKEQCLRTMLWLNRFANARGASLNSYTLLDRINIDLVLQFYDSGIVDDVDMGSAEDHSAFEEESGLGFGSSSDFDFALSSFAKAPIQGVSSSLSQASTIDFSQSSSQPKPKQEKSVSSLDTSILPLVSPALLQRIRSTRLRQVHSAVLSKA